MYDDDKRQFQGMQRDENEVFWKIFILWIIGLVVAIIWYMNPFSSNYAAMARHKAEQLVPQVPLFNSAK